MRDREVARGCTAPHYDYRYQRDRFNFFSVQLGEVHEDRSEIDKDCSSRAAGDVLPETRAAAVAHHPGAPNQEVRRRRRMRKQGQQAAAPP